MTQTCAIVPAAGMGLRMGAEKPKAFLSLDGVPILARTLLQLQSSEDIDALIPVVPPDSVQLCQDSIVDAYGIGKAIRVAAGGKTRRESVFNGLKAAGHCQLVVIHDAARPFVTNDLIKRVIAAAKNTGAAIAALPSVDTLKKVSENNRVIETLDRRGVWMVQTPQVFSFEIIAEAHAKAALGKWSATDDASLVERLGVPVMVVEGLRNNIKITSPEDMILASRILNESSAAEPENPGLSKQAAQGDEGTSGRTRSTSGRVGFGYDAHRLEPDRELWLGGVLIPYSKGLLGHSDADVLIHAICDAMLGSMALGDIGSHFPDTDRRYRGVRSTDLLRRVLEMLRRKGVEVQNVDAAIVAQAPRMAPYIPSMVKVISEILGVDENRVSIKAKTTEGMGFTGEGKGMEAYAVVMVGFPEDNDTARKETADGI